MRKILKAGALFLVLAVLISSCGLSAAEPSTSAPGQVGSIAATGQGYSEPSADREPSDAVEPSLQGDPSVASVSGDVTDLPLGVQEVDNALIPVDRFVTATPAFTPGFTVHFIDVGQSDAALIICDGAAMLIDGGNPSDSSLIYSFLRNLGITHLDYIVASHAHADHVGGLSGALNLATVGVALSPVTEYDTRAFESFVRYLGEQGVSITVPSHGDTFMLGSALVEIVGPISPSSNPNNMSIVMRITYGETSFLFTGDAERELELDILEAGYGISATVLKVGHHGSDTSTTYPFLREIMPEFAVISCGRNNQYGHPHDNVLSRLRDADVTLFRTDLQGTITAVSDGTTVVFTTQRNADVQTNPTERAVTEGHFIGNANSLRFHRPSCSTLPAEHNRVILGTREEALSGGFAPCGNCRP